MDGVALRGGHRPVVRALLASPLGFLVGLSLGALGGGGSILAVPVLVHVAGQSPRAAVGTSLVVVMLVSVAGLVPHWRAGRVRVGAGTVFGAAGIGGSLAGTAANHAIDPDALLLGFAVVMLVASVAMRRRAVAPGDRSATSEAVTTRRRVDASVAARVGLAGTGVGLLTGLLGVGGGFVIVPALVLTLHFAMPEAVGTSLLVIAMNSAVALLARLGSGSLEWHVIAPFTLAGLAGVLAGSRVADRVDPRRLASAFSAALVAIAVYTGVEAAVAL